MNDVVTSTLPPKTGVVTLTEPPSAMEQDAQNNDNNPVFEEAGGGMALEQCPLS